ncbi:MAG: hypothetical protein R3A50_00135 [Saprospiraceae bacterium]
MVLSKIQSFLEAYKAWLTQIKVHPRIHWWESVQHFQDHWDLDTEDPAAMFDSCFYNSVTKRLWQKENWEPKRMMHEYWKLDPLTTRLMFDDLFNETKSVDGRVGRFLFGCDALLSDFKKSKATSIDNNHYHNDYQMLALYLSFRYPETYAPYEFDIFRDALLLLGARDIPEQHDLPRYCKVLRTLMSFMDKDPEVEKALRTHLNPGIHFQPKTMLMAGDFCFFIGSGGELP